MLLHKRYTNHTLQEVPDRHGGDLGIEAYSLDGCVYQCYAALEPLSVKDLYENQRDKLTEDLGKLEKNKAEFKKLFGTLKIGRYVFMVHRLDSRLLLDHATKKSIEVAAMNLEFIDPDFRIMVETDQDYQVEREAVIAVPPQLLDLDTTDEETKSAWIDQNAPLLIDATRKFGAIGLKDHGLSNALNALIYQYLDGQNALEQLRERYPDHWAIVEAVRSRRERRLPLGYPPASNASITVVRTIADDLSVEMSRDAPSIKGQIAESIAWATVADWVMRCPLDFEPS